MEEGRGIIKRWSGWELVLAVGALEGTGDGARSAVVSKARYKPMRRGAASFGGAGGRARYRDLVAEEGVQITGPDSATF